MRLERQYRRRLAKVARQRDGPIDDRTMSLMHAFEISDRDDGVRQHACRRRFVSAATQDGKGSGGCHGSVRRRDFRHTQVSSGARTRQEGLRLMTPN
jgi:hypothetical protein